MEEEIEDIVGDLKYTDSQKSVATSNQYSLDFTDASSSSNSDKNNSLSGKETYVIEWDSEDSDKTIQLHEIRSMVRLTDMPLTIAPVNVNGNVNYRPKIANSSVCTSAHCTIARETFTQTSKTIIQLAENEGAIRKTTDHNTLETQTSFISITENKTVEYRIEVSSGHNNFTKREILDCNSVMSKKPAYYNITCNQVLSDSLEDESSKLPMSDTDIEAEYSSSNNDKVIRIITDESTENILGEHHDELVYENASEFESIIDSDIEEDSLMVSVNVIPKSDSSDVKDLHNKLSESEDVDLPSFDEPGIQRFGDLTPLTEESLMRKESLVDVTPMNLIGSLSTEHENRDLKDEVVFTNNAGLKVKLLKDDVKSKDSFRLPPIQNQSCPNSPHLNSLFSVNNKSNRINKAGTLPCLYERERRESLLDRWEIGTKELASGEGTLISRRSCNDDPRRVHGSIQLPPIHTEGPINTNCNRLVSQSPNHSKTNATPQDNHNQPESQDSISIKDKIKELKMSSKNRSCTKYSVSRTESRSNSPGSTSSPDNRHNEVVDRGCESICSELLRKLRSSSWFEVVETLDEMPKSLHKFWGVIAEQRIADLIRQVNLHIESPRPTVACSACNTVACILKNTNYTKKPDFYESMTILLIKTGSYSRPVRRAANVALDDIVCGVDLSHSVTALCVHGVGHKSALVRCAAARLLVVCCALASGGRALLRARPPTAAAARRFALRALSALLEDKTTDTRKYAERLYSMLRPLNNFEAYYLTDVDVDLASRQMRKYDQLLAALKER